MVLCETTVCLLTLLLQNLLIGVFLVGRHPHSRRAIHATVHRKVLLFQHLTITLLVTALNHEIMLLLVASGILI